MYHNFHVNATTRQLATCYTYLYLGMMVAIIDFIRAINKTQTQNFALFGHLLSNVSAFGRSLGFMQEYHNQNRA